MKKLLPTLLILFFIQGCLPTLHPLYKNMDGILQPSLFGEWKSSSDITWHFVAPTDSADSAATLHLINMADGTDSISFVGGFVELGNELYLDLSIVEFETDAPYFNKHTMFVHSIHKAEIYEDSLILKPFNSKWLRNMIKNNQIRIKHEIVDAVDSRTLITASTDELQRFVRKYGSDERAYDKPSILRRVKND